MEIVIPYEKVNVSDLTSRERSLYESTLAAMEGAYAPYSNFKVGCGILIQSGEVVVGNNQENAAYPSGLCAERVAFFKLRSESMAPIESVMVTTINGKGQKLESFPCGACRQVMLEYAHLQEKPISFFMQADEDHFYKVLDLKHLLPFSFTNKVL